MESVPAGSVVVLNDATPLEFNVAVPRVAVPFRNVIKPVGTVLPEAGVTAAVNVIFCPVLIWVAEAVRAVVVETKFDVRVTTTGDEVELASFVSPP
jgi:hypothetical protein